MGIRVNKLNPTDEAFLTVIDWMFNGFLNIREDLISAKQEQLRMSLKVDALGTKIVQ